ncbi:MAG: hypothetical protein LBT40_16865 [Deltaproteobacteria bacterium]|nr:hypothetical protein [Deltaproteobacteria bacterium]
MQAWPELEKGADPGSALPSRVPYREGGGLAPSWDMRKDPGSSPPPGCRQERPGEGCRELPRRRGQAMPELKKGADPGFALPPGVPSGQVGASGGAAEKKSWPA